MDRLRNLIRAHPDLLGNQPAFEALIERLDEEQADALATMLVVFLRTLGADEEDNPVKQTLH